MGPSRSDATAPRRTRPHNAYSFLAKCIAAGLLVLAADWLFYGHMIGWTGGLFGLAALTAIVTTRPFTLKNIEGRICLILAGGLCLALFNDPSLYSISLLWLAIAAVTLAPVLAGTRNAKRWAGAFVSHLIRTWIRLAADIPALLRTKRRRAAKRHGPEVNLWALPIAGSVVFAGLFIAANPIIDDAVTDWLSASAVSPDAFYRFVFWITVLIVVWSTLRPRIRLRSERRAEPEIQSPWRARLMSERSVVYSLVLFNGLFAAQNALDVAFLWSGAPLPEGLTYAEYAHRGAYPLIVTALLAGAFVLIALRPDADGAQRPGIRWLVYAWILQNVFLVFSCMLRTLDYVEAYSLTLMRLSALIWMALVAIGLVLICVRILRSKSGLWLINANSLACVAVLYVCAFPDFNAVVADYNVRHSLAKRGVALDITYLESLGPSSIAALTWFEDQDILTYKRQESAGARNRLTGILRCKLTDWRHWTFLRHRIWQKVEAVDVPERLSMCTPTSYRSIAERTMESAP